MTVRGGGVPAKTTALMPMCRMGPPPRSFRCDAHHCIMVWVLTHRIQGCGTNVRATTRGLPSYRHPDHSKCAVVLEPVKDEALAGGALRAILDGFCARQLLRNRVGRDEETAAGRTKKLRDENMDRTLAAPP